MRASCSSVMAGVAASRGRGACGARGPASHRRDRVGPAWAVLLATTVALGLLVVPASLQAQASDPWRLSSEARRAISDWDYERAATVVEQATGRFPDHPGTRWARGELMYHLGEYEEAVRQLNLALQDAAGQPWEVPLRTLHELVSNTAQTVSGYERYVSPDGLFVILHEPRDAVLMPWAAATLEAAWYQIGYSVGYWPEDPVRVEIFPRASLLSVVSSLPAEAVETTSTIGLCKYNKLMFASPRAAARGYPWRDTLAHEYVHYVISRATRNRVPVWLHEGIAKYLESRWTGAWDAPLNPSREDLLGRRLDAGDFITFEEMSPSIALLPSQEDAALAYAEVYTVIEYLVLRRGHGAIRELLVAIRDGATPEEAFAIVAGEDWPVFERNWMAWLRNERPRVQVPGTFDDEEIVLRESGGEQAENAELAGMRSPQARDFMHLGELLRARGQIRAAIREYRKAEALMGAHHPVVQNGMARALLDTGEPERALAALRDVVRWYPTYYLSHLNRADALNRLGRHDDALIELEAAVSINPFDPRVHEQFAVAFDALGRPDDALRARDNARRVEP